MTIITQFITDMSPFVHQGLLWSGVSTTPSQCSLTGEVHTRNITAKDLVHLKSPTEMCASVPWSLVRWQYEQGCVKLSTALIGNIIRCAHWKHTCSWAKLTRNAEDSFVLQYMHPAISCCCTYLFHLRPASLQTPCLTHEIESTYTLQVQHEQYTLKRLSQWRTSYVQVL